MNERILVVDDEADIARLLEMNLSAEGFTVLVVTQAPEAVQQAVAFRPDLVLLDVNMPAMDGLAVLRQLRSDALTAGASIILLTAKANLDDRVVGLAAGADDYITKPFDLDELISRVRAALRRSQQLRGVSPLTGLPGNFEILRQLQALVDDSAGNVGANGATNGAGGDGADRAGAGADGDGSDGAGFALIHADLDNFKAYNDHYGFVRGDEAIQATAELLLSVLGEVEGRPRFLGHVGGDDFALIVPADAVEAVADALVARFDDLARSLYDAEDQDRGTVMVKGRDGASREVAFLTLSLGVATTATRPFSSPVEMAAVASEMKQYAKQQTGSAWRVDRRRTATRPS